MDLLTDARVSVTVWWGGITKATESMGEHLPGFELAALVILVAKYL
jgi:hypothetical protein